MGDQWHANCVGVLAHQAHPEACLFPGRVSGMIETRVTRMEGRILFRTFL